MKAKLFFFLIILSTKIHAQNDTIFLEEYNLNALGKYKDDKPHGEWTYFYLDGKKQSEGLFTNGKLTGTWTNWHPSGNLEYQMVYENDKVVQIKSMFYDSGEAFACTDFFDKGMQLMNVRAHLDAKAYFDKSTQLCPDSTKIWHVSAVNRMYMEDYEGAIDVLSKSLEIDKDNAETFHRRGQAYFQNKQDTEALSDINRSIDLDPHYLKNYLLKGMVFYNEEKYHEAIDSYNALIARSDDSNKWKWRAMKFKAEIYVQLNDHDNALKSYNLYVKNNPDDVEGIIGRAEVYLSLGKNSKACEDWHKAIVINSYVAELEDFKDICN